MFHLVCFPLLHYCDNIKTDGQRKVEKPDVRIGCRNDTAHLGTIDSCFRSQLLPEPTDNRLSAFLLPQLPARPRRQLQYPAHSDANASWCAKLDTLASPKRGVLVLLPLFRFHFVSPSCPFICNLHKYTVFLFYLPVQSYICNRMALKRKYSSPQPNHPRVHKVTFMLNDEEQKAVERYLAKYKIINKSRWYRETILTHILRTLEEDYPTLFKENEMRR